MLKIVFIGLVVLALNNPTPGGGKNGQPNQNQTSAKPTASGNTNTPSESLAFAPLPASNAPPIGDLKAPRGKKGTADSATDSHDNPSKQNWGDPNWWMVGITGALLVVGIGQFFMYLFQWQNMKAALKHTVKLSRLNLTHDRNAAARALDHAREISQKELRAYVGIMNATSEHADIHRRQQQAHKNLTLCNFTLKNVGRTPARRVRSEVAWRLTADIADVPDFPISTDSPAWEIRSSTDLVSEQEATTNHFLGPHDGLSFPDAWSKMTQNGQVLFLFGIATYDDIYGDAHKTRVCVVSRLLGSQLFCSTFNRYNDSD